MSKETKTTEELFSELTPLERKKLDFIMKRLKRVGAEYNEREVIFYARRLLNLTWKELRQKSWEDIANVIYKQLDRAYAF